MAKDLYVLDMSKCCLVYGVGREAWIGEVVSGVEEGKTFLAEKGLPGRKQER